MKKRIKTTINISDDLIKEAMKITTAPTNTALIKTALNNTIQKNKIKSIKNYKGKIDIAIELNSIRKRRTLQIRNF